MDDIQHNKMQVYCIAETSSRYPHTMIDSHSPNSNSRSEKPTTKLTTTKRRRLRHRCHSGSEWWPVRAAAFEQRRLLAAALDADAADVSDASVVFPHRWKIDDANAAQSTPSRSWFEFVCVCAFFHKYSTETSTCVNKCCFYR